VSTPLRGSGIFLSVNVAVMVVLLLLWVTFRAAACQPLLDTQQAACHTGGIW